MFQQLFQFIRTGIREAVLGGLEDAQKEINHRLESQQPVTIEHHPEPENGKPKSKRTARV